MPQRVVRRRRHPPRRLRGIDAVGALSTITPSRYATSVGSPPRRSWGSAGSCPASTRAATNTWRGKITKAGNVHVRTQLSGVRPGRTATNPTCRPTCVAANKASTPPWPPGRGPPSCDCADGSVTSPPANNPNPPSPRRSPANSPGSSGPNSPRRDVTSFARPSRRSTPTTAGPPPTRQPPADADPIPGRSLLSGATGGEHKWGQLLRIHTLRSQPRT